MASPILPVCQKEQTDSERHRWWRRWYKLAVYGEIQICGAAHMWFSRIGCNLYKTDPILDG